MLKFVLAFFPFLFFAQKEAKVIGISDGDTITVLLEDRSKLKLRLADVDCPESGQPFGKNAKDFTSSIVFGKNIIFYDMGQDRYGRTIAKVYYNNKYLSAEIIKNGLGWWYEKYSKNYDLKKSQDSAKNLKVGLWTDKNAISPFDWRQQNMTRF